LMCFFTFELIVLKKKSFKREIAPIKCIIFLIQARNVQMMYWENYDVGTCVCYFILDFSAKSCIYFQWKMR
jgi:hypothetical protein